MSEQSNLSPASIYLDNAATTMVDRRVLDAMYGVMSSGRVGNAGARHHQAGAAAHNLTQVARAQVAEAIGARASEIIFTSGATEANNLAIKGIAAHLKASGKTHIITSAVEHKSVLETLRALRAEGFDITECAVKPCGMIEAKMIKHHMRDETGLVCVQAVNNETGTIQPIDEIAAMLEGTGVLFHCDGAQALGKIKFSTKSKFDFASLSAHKVYGPQGIGALYVRSEMKSLVKPLNSGGGQEFGLRAGTLPVALCVGFGKACTLLENDRQHLQSLRWEFLNRISWLNPEVFGHSDPEWNVPGILNLRFPGVETETLVMSLPSLAFGLGAACSDQASHVIRAITGSDQAARESFRLSFGRFTTHEEIRRAADLLIDALENIKDLQGVA
ncbi:MAG: cysteine desulfurase [Leptolyngbya sp.]|nr:cysteine desulfurase [Candidatus Melainabacteria bacterium]